MLNQKTTLLMKLEGFFWRRVIPILSPESKFVTKIVKVGYHFSQRLPFKPIYLQLIFWCWLGLSIGLGLGILLAKALTVS